MAWQPSFWNLGSFSVSASKVDFYQFCRCCLLNMVLALKFIVLYKRQLRGYYDIEVKKMFNVSNSFYGIAIVNSF